MMKNLPKEYREVFSKISNMNGFIGIIDESTLDENNTLWGKIGLVFENIKVVDKKEYFLLTQEFYSHSKDEYEDRCYLYPTTEKALVDNSKFIAKDALLTELEV